ncbi:MAG: 30S ribosomal protein S2 [Candidatus Abawacabacteria bacterium]|nr:30S ribosomal protein S2 [Candidatus Abawacabacteria bacterium]
MQDLLQAGVHFGHRTQRWNPKMKSYLYGKRHGIHIFDLEQTAHALNNALQFLYNQASIGKSILFVSTKNQTSEILPVEAKKANVPYLANRWPGGFLTNFPTVKKRIQYLISLEGDIESGELTKKYTKKEALMFKRTIGKLNEVLEGVKILKSLPDVIFVADAVRDRLAIVEAKKMGIAIVAICDSNSDPDLVDYVIPANDDALRSLNMIISAASDAIQQGRKAYAPTRDEGQERKRDNSAQAKPIDKLEISAEVMAEKEAAEKAPAKVQKAKSKE